MMGAMRMRATRATALFLALASAAGARPATGADRRGDAGAAGGRTGGVALPVLGLYAAAGEARVATAEAIRRGAEIAVALGREAEGGSGAVRLVAAPAPDPWSAGAGELVRLVYDDGAVAVLGPVDAQAAHVAAQVAARFRGRVVVLTPWASDPRLTRAGVPWFLRLAHDDRLQAEALLGEIVVARGLRRVLLILDPEDGDSARGAEAFERAAERRGATLRTVARHAKRGADGALEDRALDASRAFRPEAVALFAPPLRAARVARRLRSSGVEAGFFGPLGLASEAFLEAAGRAAEGTVLAAPPRPEGPRADRFRLRYRERYGRDPGTAAFYGHDGALLLARALRDLGHVWSRGPVHRPGEALRRILEGSAIDGLTGPIELDGKGNRVGPAPLSRVERGVLSALRSPPQRGERRSPSRGTHSRRKDDADSS